METKTLSLAPVCIFVYLRLDHFVQTIDALLDNDLAEQTPVFIFSDAAKSEMDSDRVEAIRQYANGISGFKSVTLISRQKNLGLSGNIIDGVSTIIQEYGKVIVLEDDIVTSKYFLSFMNDALENFKNNSEVGCVHGYLYPDLDISEPFFLRGADCWGWGTWSDRWSYFNSDAQQLFYELKKERYFYDFDFCGTYPFSKMLKNNMRKKNDSWAIRWYASLYLRNMLTLYPHESLVNNIGHDDSGMNCKFTTAYLTQLSNQKISVDGLVPIESRCARKKFAQYFEKLSRDRIKIVFNIIRKLCCRYGIII